MGQSRTCVRLFRLLSHPVAVVTVLVRGKTTPSHLTRTYLLGLGTRNPVSRAGSMPNININILRPNLQQTMRQLLSLFSLSLNVSCFTYILKAGHSDIYTPGFRNSTVAP